MSPKLIMAVGTLGHSILDHSWVLVDLHLSCILTFGSQDGVTSTKLASRSNFIFGQQAKHIEHSWSAVKGLGPKSCQCSGLRAVRSLVLA